MQLLATTSQPSCCLRPTVVHQLPLRSFEHGCKKVLNQPALQPRLALPVGSRNSGLLLGMRYPGSAGQRQLAALVNLVQALPTPTDGASVIGRPGTLRWVLHTLFKFFGLMVIRYGMFS